ncbi:MAG: NUDIX hydrolase [Candidatus Nealsonbacteria bacterium]
MFYKKSPWQRLSRKRIYTSRFLEVFKDRVKVPKQKLIAEYFLTKKEDVVVIVATTMENKIIMLKEYKYAANKFLNVLPAGHIKKKENPTEAAKRELLEETGYTSNDFTYLGSLYEYPTQDLHQVKVVRAKNAFKIAKVQHEPTENISVLVKPISAIKKEILKCKLQTCSSLGALALAGLLF